MNFLGFPQSSSSSSSSSVDLTDVKTDILPDITNLRDVGNNTKRWRNGAFKNLTCDTAIANSFATPTGTGAQYLMANGTTLTQSAQPGQSNYYLYTNITNITAPIGGQITYNNSAQGFAAFVYISHLTSAGVDIDVFLASVNVLNDLYIQDEADSTNFIKYNITAPPTPVVTNPGFYSIPVSMITYGGNGNSSFGSNQNILVSFFSNTAEINARISTLETKTYNQSAVPGTTTISGTLTANTLSKTSGLPTQFLKADGTVDATSYLPIGTPSIVAGYAFNPVQNGTNLPTSSTKSYYFTVLLNQNTIISGFTIYLDNGSDVFRMGIFRGNLTNSGPPITLCGQSAGGPLNAATIMNRVAITAVSGQNLNFISGEYITIAFHSQGITNVFMASPLATGISQELAWNSSANYASAGFPATLSSPSISGAIQIRPCFELY